MNGRRSFPVRIPIYPYLFDHRLGGKAVYPAAEVIQTLSETVRKAYPDVSVSHSRNAEFRRFLPLPEKVPRLEAVVELTPDNPGRIRASLLSEFKAPRSNFTRLREHARVIFGNPPPVHTIPMDVACAPEGVCRKIDPESLYREIVSLGPSYHNVRGDIHLSRDGASAYLSSTLPVKRPGPLGSPFVIDAAFHVACAWGHYHTGRVTIPVGYDQRLVLRPAVPQEKYYCRVIPKKIHPEELAFDIWIFNLDGKCCEAVRGVKMREVFPVGKRVSRETGAGPENPLQDLEEYCLGLSVMELDALAPFSSLSFSRREKARYRTLGEKRKRSYAGARMALKRLTRKLPGAGDPAVIDTLAKNPGSPVPGDECYFSAAHDNRFAVAAAGAHPIGVDVEPENDKILGCRGVFLSGPEKKLMAGTSLPKEAALLRAWGIKEAAAKALGITLPGAWKRAEVKKIGRVKSIVTVNEKSLPAYHASAGGHLFTILELKHGKG